jgi:hypothetical protein
MWRLAIALLATVLASGAAESADGVLAPRSWHRTAVMLPAGLPRPHYRFRTTISYGAPYPYRPPYGPRLTVYETPPLLYAPVYTDAYVAPVVGLRPPPYYGEAYVPYWDRLPYGCGAYGYC